MGIVAGAPGGDRCRDIELPVPVAPGAASKVRRLVRGLSAKGITPPSRALIQAPNILTLGRYQAIWYCSATEGKSVEEIC